jgi:hypothetical protein
VILEETWARGISSTGHGTKSGTEETVSGTEQTRKLHFWPSGKFLLGIFSFFHFSFLVCLGSRFSFARDRRNLHHWSS